MKISKPFQYLFRAVIALVWLINGLFCKVMDLVPRHELIVSRILGDEYGSIATRAIGTGEIFIAVWILSGVKSKYCAAFQIILVVSMNIIEFMIVPDLLLFGKFNIVIALIFAAMVYTNEFLTQGTGPGYVMSKKT